MAESEQDLGDNALSIEPGLLEPGPPAYRGR